MVFKIFDTVLRLEKGSHDSLLRKVKILTASLKLSGELDYKVQEMQACYESLTNESSPLKTSSFNLILSDSDTASLSPQFLDKVFQEGYRIIEDAHKKGSGLRPLIDNPWQYALYVIAGISDSVLRQKTFDYIKTVSSDKASTQITPYQWIRGELVREAI